ncbi:hypothetical protein NC651_010805 [Populus alba x Populus x berolinensis]|nr:hypothetical protein NC651_010805 [Populus alba x Populus x berolinensis]
MAIQALLITDDLFRNTDIPTRRKLAHLVKSVKDSGKLLVYFHQCTFQESRWQCIPASLQIFDFLCRTLNILSARIIHGVAKLKTEETPFDETTRYIGSLVFRSIILFD